MGGGTLPDRPLDNFRASSSDWVTTAVAVPLAVVVAAVVAVAVMSASVPVSLPVSVAAVAAVGVIAEVDLASVVEANVVGVITTSVVALVLMTAVSIGVVGVLVEVVALGRRMVSPAPFSTFWRGWCSWQMAAPDKFFPVAAPWQSTRAGTPDQRKETINESGGMGGGRE